MGTINSTGKSLIPGQDISTLYTTHLDTYFSKEEELRLSEDFRQQVLLGALALTDKNASPPEVTQIHAQLASCYFHLGEHELSLEHANKCQLISEYLDELHFLIQSLYLLSANKRTAANLCTHEEGKKRLFQEATSLIHKAMKHCDRYGNDFLRAKVLFNTAAVYTDDPNASLRIAIQCYQEASELFLSLDEYNDYTRTLIRLGRVWFIQQKYDALRDLLDTIDTLKLPKTIKVDYQHLDAQYYVKMKEYRKASSIILDGIEISTELGGKTDISRFNVLLELIHKEEGYLYLHDRWIKC